MSVALSNRLLDALPAADLCRIQPHLRRTSLREGASLNTHHQPTASVYFPISGAVSLVAQTSDGESVEVAVTGADGMVGAFEILGQTQTPFTARVQVPGAAWCLPVTAFQQHLSDCGALLTLVLGYLQCLMVQVTQSAVCNRFHTAEQRLARWLLTTAVVSGRHTFMLTHDQLAQMVGCPRSAITSAAAALRDAGLVDYARARLTVLDRDGLEGMACNCFRVVEPVVRGGCVPAAGRVA